MIKKNLSQFNTVREYCDHYFNNYDREAWLEIRKVRYGQIRDNHFYLNKGADVFKKEVLQFWAGWDGRRGWSYGNSEIQKGDNGEWILLQDKNGNTVNPEIIFEELGNNNLDLHGNYSWSMLFRGGDITDDMEKLRNTLNYLFDENKDIVERFNKALEIQGMGHGKASALLHIKYPGKYGVWNSCTDGAFKILNQVQADERFRIREGNKGKKYEKINLQLNNLLNEYPYKSINEETWGFKNLSDVDIFVWYIANKSKIKK